MLWPPTPPMRLCCAVASLPVAAALLIGGCSTGATGPAGGPGTANPTTRPAPHPLVLPAAQAYVDAVNAGNLDALVAAFGPEGEVIDVTRRIRGRDAIRAWARNEVIGGTLRVDGVTALGPGTQRLRVHWAPSGSGGFAADYTFTTRDDQILVAELQYA